jgi:D-alanyl-D-alanine carboxypeptidase
VAQVDRGLVLLFAVAGAFVAPGQPPATPATPPALATAPIPAAIRERIANRCQQALDELFAHGHFPGGSAALILADGSEQTFTVGVAAEQRPMQPTDRMLAGSIGKTFVAATALRWIATGKLSLDARAAEYLGELEWFERLPNAERITVQQLLRHQSGLMRYELDRAFWKDLLADPDKSWQPAELLAYVLDRKPLFAAGEGWSYADTNYIVLGMVIEKVTGKPVFEDIRNHLLEPHGLRDTLPSDQRKLPGLIEGTSGFARQLGIPEQVIQDGAFVINPQFEWCGGGFLSTPLDLARWARVLFTGKAFAEPYLEPMLDAVAAPGLGANTRYGAGVIVRETTAGPLHGHDGMFPGYLSTMGYFPAVGCAAAFQINKDTPPAPRIGMHELLVTFAGIVREELGQRR